MIIYRQTAPLVHKLQQLRREGRRIGFVPTMGALHQGHMGLIEAALRQSDVTVCSIFVNPAQFNDPKDFEKYPLTPEADILKLTRANASILFLPSVEEIYPDGRFSGPGYDLGHLGQVLEGKYRPGHFQGVCMVMDRLLNIVQPDELFMGQKDYQQCMVIRRLIEILGLSVRFNVVPTYREPNGLAMSSRNMLLSDGDKVKATGMHRALQYIKDHAGSEPVSELCRQAGEIIRSSGFEKTDYVAVCDADTLTPIDDSPANDRPKVALAAAFISGIRLIDNLLL